MLANRQATTLDPRMNDEPDHDTAPSSRCSRCSARSHQPARVVWAWAGLAGVLFGSGWPPRDRTGARGRSGRLPAHLEDPKLAWPPAVARSPGPAAGFYAALALLVAIVRRRADARPPRVAVRALGRPARVTSARGARWARPRRAAAHFTRPPDSITRAREARGEQGRLALGYQGRRLLRAEARHALVVFGPTQSYKSAGLAIPALLEWDGPAIASSTKTDLLPPPSATAERLGEVMVFDPFGLSPAPSTHLVAAARRRVTGTARCRHAMRMTAGAELDTSTVRDGSLWRAAAEAAPRAAAVRRRADRRRDRGGRALGLRARRRRLPAILQTLLAKRPKRPRARRRAGRATTRTPRLTRSPPTPAPRSSQTVQVILRAYRSPRVQASADRIEITPDRLLAGRATVYLIGDATAHGCCARSSSRCSQS